MLAKEQSFSKSQRLLKPREFRNAFAKGKRLRCQAFTITAARNEFEHPRIGLAISKKSTPRAVDRNRLKRVIRESFRAHTNKLRPVDIVVQVTRTARSLSNDVLVNKLGTMWAALQ